MSNAQMDERGTATMAECAVCWSETGEEQFAMLPCCTAPEGSTMRYCSRCVEIICENGPSGVGRCPTCRAFIRKAKDGGFEVADRVEVCTLCRQNKFIIADSELIDDGFCFAEFDHSASID